MTKIVRVDGRTSEAQKPVEQLTSDPGLIALCHIESVSDLRKLWLTRKVKTVDIQIALQMQLVADIQLLTSSIGVLFKQLEILNSQSPRG